MPMPTATADETSKNMIFQYFLIPNLIMLKT